MIRRWRLGLYFVKWHGISKSNVICKDWILTKTKNFTVFIFFRRQLHAGRLAVV